MNNKHAMTDEQREQIEGLVPKDKATGRPPRDHREMVEAMIYREKEGCRWRSLPTEFGSYSGVYTRYRKWSLDGTLQRIFEALSAAHSQADEIEADGTIVRAHQHSAGAKKGGRNLKSVRLAGD